MKTKGRLKSMNIEDKRPGKIKPWYDGLPLASTFKEQFPYYPPKDETPPPTKKTSLRGRQAKITKSGKIRVKKTGGYKYGS